VTSLRTDDFRTENQQDGEQNSLPVNKEV